MVSVVTGGAGFVGRHLVARLLAEGEEVRVLDTATDRPTDPRVDMNRGSVTDKDTVRRVLKGARAVYHLAANAQLWARDKRDFHTINFLGTRTVLEEAERAGVERFVHTSSITVLVGHATRPHHIVGEQTSRALEDMLGPYCRSKLLAEREALAFAARGLPVVVVIPTLPVGPGDFGMTPPTRMILDFVNGRVPAYLECLLNMVDVRDVAAGHIAARHRGRIGERYILGHENLTMCQLLGELKVITGAAIPRRKVPYALAWLTGQLSERMADLVTGRPPRAPLSGVRLAGRQPAIDSAKAIRELGFPQSAIRTALRDEILWFQESQMISRPLPALDAGAPVTRPTAVTH